MTTTRPATARTPNRQRGFAAASLSYVAVFAAGATPIPLYNVYSHRSGITPADLSVVSAGYFIVAVATLLLLGRVSDHLGRRPVALAALLAAAIGCGVLTQVDGTATLLVGRSLQGLAAGLASSGLGAYAVDTAPETPSWLLPTLTSTGPNVGLTLGAFGSAILVDDAPAPRLLVYCIAVLVLVGCAVAIAVNPETRPREPGLRQALRPRLQIPASSAAFLPAAAAIFISTWAFGGYFQSFGPSVAATALGSADAVTAAAILAAYLAPSALGGPLTSSLSPRAGQRVGMLLVLLGSVGFVTAIVISALPLFLAAGVIGGIGMGAATSSSLRALLPQAAPSERAGLLASVYATSYLGAAVPGLIAGQATRIVPLLTVTIAYGFLAAAAAIVVVTTARSPSPPGTR